MKKRQRPSQKKSSTEIDFKSLAYRLADWLKANKRDCHIAKFPSNMLPNVIIVEIVRDYKEKTNHYEVICGGAGVGEQQAFKSMVCDFCAYSNNYGISQSISSPNALDVFLAAAGF